VSERAWGKERRSWKVKMRQREEQEAARVRERVPEGRRRAEAGLRNFSGAAPPAQDGRSVGRTRPRGYGGRGATVGVVFGGKGDS